MYIPPHPGEFITATYMEPLGISCCYLAELSVGIRVMPIEFCALDQTHQRCGALTGVTFDAKAEPGKLRVVAG